MLYISGMAIKQRYAGIASVRSSKSIFTIADIIRKPTKISAGAVANPGIVQADNTARAKNITALETQLSTLKDENDDEYNRVTTSVDLEKIRDIAMNELGILVDVSHLSDGGFYDVAKISKKPFVATHSDCRALAAHPRNLTDDMIRLLAQKGGVSGINFAPAFLDDTQGNKTSRISDMVRHVKHFIEIGGEDCVGIGTDFDGIGGNLEVGEPGQLALLFEALEKAGITPRQIDKIASGNVLRVMKETMRPRFE